VLLVSTLDGQLSALDLNKDGEMFWSVSTDPGNMLSSTISQMDLDTRGQYAKLIPSLTGRLYKFNGEVVEPIPLDVDSLLGSSLKMQENVVVTGGKESRTYGVLLETGEILYECSMNDCTNFQENTTKDILVIQRNTQTVRAHTPRSGEQKWNFSVSLHDVAFHPSDDPCQDPPEDLIEGKDDFTLKSIVPEGVICATRNNDEEDLIKWKRKFQTPIVDVWRIKNGQLSKINLFSKNHIPKKNGYLDDDDKSDDDANPSLYIGKHNNQLYIQESVGWKKETDSFVHDYGLDPSNNEIDFPRVTWKPYLVSPSRTPTINHGAERPLITFEQTIKRGDSKVTALAITDTNADYPYDAGFYLYTDTTALDPDHPLNNITALSAAVIEEGEGPSEKTFEENTVEYILIYSLWPWWKEVIFISLLTAVMMNVLITRPLIHEMRDNFQERSRELVQHVQNIQSENAIKEVVREVFVEVPVPALTSLTPTTPSTGTSNGSSGPDFSLYSRQSSDFSSRFLSDFEPLQCLGRGGFGVVFECKNKYDDIHYAVKRITLPSSEESKKKVMREVKLHAKLDHKNIVRYFSTWLETPPSGWQEQADAWFDEADMGTGPTPFDPTDTDYSLSNIEKKKIINPLRPFAGFTNTGNTNTGFTSSSNLEKSNNSVSFRDNCDTSFSIRFEDEISETCDASDETGEASDCDIIEHQDDDESTGGIVFNEHTNEIKGETEAVALDIETSHSGGPVIQFNQTKSDSSDSLSCCEAIEWDSSNQNKQTPAAVKVKSYLYIVMQLCRKETLRDWLRNNSVREEACILSLFYQICGGVEYVHKQGLIHRDLKPSNIYFSTDGSIKIGDFGLVTGSSLELTASGQSDTTLLSVCTDDQLTDQVGTQLYMSPEQLAQKPYNHKVDIFSLGLIFLELLVPFSTQMERLHTLSDGKKGRYPSQVAEKPEYTSLLGLMLNGRSDVRPDTTDILQLPWLQDCAEVEGSSRKRRETIGSEQTADIATEINFNHTNYNNNVNINIMDEEQLDN